MGFMSPSEKANALGTHLRDQALASQVEALRGLGRKFGQEAVYEKRIEKVIERFKKSEQ